MPMEMSSGRRLSSSAAIWVTPMRTAPGQPRGGWAGPAPRRPPARRSGGIHHQVFEHMDEVDQDRHRALAPCGLSSDPLDLMAVAVDQRNPAAQMLGIASLGLVEHLAHDLGGVLHDAG